MCTRIAQHALTHSLTHSLTRHLDRSMHIAKVKLTCLVEIVLAARRISIYTYMASVFGSSSPAKNKSVKSVQRYVTYSHD